MVLITCICLLGFSISNHMYNVFIKRSHILKIIYFIYSVTNQTKTYTSSGDY